MKSIRVTAFSFMAACLLSSGGPSFAETIEWTEKKQLKTEVAPIDLATSADGKWLIVLTPGELLVYTMPGHQVVNRMPLDKAFDKLAYSSADDTVIMLLR